MPLQRKANKFLCDDYLWVFKELRSSITGLGLFILMKFGTPVKASEPNFGAFILKHFQLCSENWEFVCVCVYVPVLVHVLFTCKCYVNVKK